jgi:glutamate synthase (NADPH/NADH) small chain|tara:strand:- start:110 stop:1552 length:1443 start_codon:yes stop_codon:yes gene_type:complete
MGKTTGFLEIEKKDHSRVAVTKRIKNFREFDLKLSDKEISRQGARCMDCGIPYCHQGCPVNNIIPDWNDLVYRNEWKRAIDVLHSTNNFPEFTGRICPAPCEESCTLNINNDPVTIKNIEQSIIDKAWKMGWIKSQPAKNRTGKHVAVVGSGPAGLACAQQLARAGHKVTVFEKSSKIGGLLRYGIPDFKMEKYHIDRRVEQMKSEGVLFKTNIHVGENFSENQLLKTFDAIVLACGSEEPRDLPVSGRDLGGIYFAMDFLTQQNKRVEGCKISNSESILANKRHVVVIGGGDTGSDCIGTSNRQKAKTITQLEILLRPPVHENKELVWPNWPTKLRTSSSHEEGCKRDWSVSTKSFNGKNGNVNSITLVRVKWEEKKNGDMIMEEMKGSEFKIKADLVLLAMGFVHPIHDGLVKNMKLKLDSRGNIVANETDYKTSRKKIFVAGDMRRGQSLVVWAIREGRQAARSVDEYLMGSSDLPN